MAIGDDAFRDARTEMIPWAHGDGRASTLELPQADEPADESQEPASATRAPASTSPAAPAPAATAPTAAAQAAPAPTAALPVAPRPPAAAPRATAPTRPAASRSRIIGAFAALVVVAAVTGAGYGWWSRSASTGSGAAAQAAPQVIRPASVASFDPSGGSGLRHDGNQWRTQTYTSPTFGNLKDGVGLVLDLGSAREVASIALPVTATPIAVELRASDSAATTISDYRAVASPTTVDASGTVTLTATDAAAHRYWMVWISRLAPQDGGYAAVIGEPVVRGR